MPDARNTRGDDDRRARREPGSSRSDAALVASCRRGDARAWEALILRYRRLIYSVPSVYGIRGDGADELFQRVAVLLYENLDRIRRIESLPAWLVVTSRREARAWLARQRRWQPMDESWEQRLEGDSPDVVSRIQVIESEHVLERAFERLEDGCRQLLTALYLEDPAPSYETLAKRLGRPIGSLGPTRARCLAKLRRLFEKLGGTAP